MKQILVEKIFHKNKTQIALRFETNQLIKSKIKTIDGIAYSRTFGCWYIPYLKSSYSQFCSLKIPYKIIASSGSTDVPSSKGDHTTIFCNKQKIAIVLGKQGTKRDVAISNSNSKEVVVSWNGNGFYVKLPYNKENVAKIRGLKGSWWSSKHENWIVKSSLENLEKLQEYFTCFSKSKYGQLLNLIGLQIRPLKIELYKTPEFPEKVMIKLTGKGVDVNFIKQIPDRSYNTVYKRWEIPSDEIILNRILQYYSGLSYKVINRLPQKRQFYEKNIPKTEDRVIHYLSKFDQKYHPSLERNIGALVRMKYSWKTVISYTGKLVKVMKFARITDMNELKSEHINDYLVRLGKQDVSASTINVIYSAVKFYFEKAATDKFFEMHKLKRPKKGRALPAILSVQEVNRLISESKNLKHTTILYSIYGGGLRLGETLNLRVEDIHWDRNQVLIKGGKGKKDRMVMLSQLLKELLKKYFDEYQPQYWLFEGQDGIGQYSSSSVQHLVKRFAKLAGITRRVTPHTLRHCFATHLMDKGLDCRFIQELLGHKDIKTTLIYTHVTNKSLEKIRSPLDDMVNPPKNNQFD